MAAALGPRRGALRREHGKLDLQAAPRKPPGVASRCSQVPGSSCSIVQIEARAARVSVEVELCGVAQAEAQRVRREHAPGAERLAFALDGGDDQASAASIACSSSSACASACARKL